MHPITELRAAARPFVERSLRGPRLRRSIALSLLLAVITCALGLWLALGHGELERDVREGVGLERSIWTRMHEDHVYIAHDSWDFHEAEYQREALLEDTDRELATMGGVVASMTNQGMQTAIAAVQVDRVPARHAALRERTAEALARHRAWVGPESVGRSYGFDWNRPEDVRRLAAIVDRDFVPAVETYASPLSVGGAIGVIGLLAAFVLFALGTVVGPVLVGIAVAQEAHENTLQPLSGTSLSPRQIALGLILGPLAPIAIVAAPQLVLALAAAFAVGHPLPVLAFLVVLLPCAWVIATLAQGVGLHAGKRRGPGTIGMALLALASTWALTGVVLGLEGRISNGKAAAMTLLPSGALSFFLREAFITPLRDVASVTSSFDAGWFAGRLAVAMLACLVVGTLALLATERRIFGRFGTPLLRHEAWIGVAVLATLTLLAVPEAPTQAWLATLAMLIMPMQILLMGRVPVGDAPEGAARVRTGALLGEFASFFAIHAVLALVVLGAGWLGALHPLALAQIGWGLLVAGLVSIRVVALPARLPALAWAGFSYVVAIVTFATGAVNIAIASEPHRGAGAKTPIFVLWEASPWLGLVQAGLTIAIPVLFLRALASPARADAVARGEA